MQSVIKADIYTVTTHQFRYKGITDRLRADFTLAQIAEMAAHHGSAMIYAYYAHLDLFPETLSEPQEYFCEIPKKGPLYPVRRQDFEYGQRLPRRDFWRICVPTVCPVVFAQISPTAEAICGTAECFHFISEKNSSPILRSRQRLGWIRRKNSRTTA